MRSLWILLWVTVPFSIWGQDYQQKYEELMSTGQLNKIPALLELWENAAPEDDQLYITGFNHYLTISKEQHIIRPTQVDSNTTTGHEMISSEIFYNDSLFQISQNYIRKGIAEKPKRLDLHLGKIHALWLKGDHLQMTSEILGLIQWNKKIRKDWYWEEEKLENPDELFKSSINDYVVKLYGSNQITYMQQISKKMVKSYPKDIPSLTNLGASYLTEGRYKKARKYFRKAHKINPKDIVVLNNLGDTYDFLEKPEKAISYYKKIQEYGNAQQQKYAATKIHDIQLRMENNE